MTERVCVLCVRVCVQCVLFSYQSSQKGEKFYIPGLGRGVKHFLKGNNFSFDSKNVTKVSHMIGTHYFMCVLESKDPLHFSSNTSILYIFWLVILRKE